MSYPTSPSGTWSRYRDSRYYGPTWVFCIGPKKHWNEPSAHALVTTVARGYRLTVHVCEDAFGRRDVCDLIFTTRDEAMTVGMNTCAAEMRSLEVKPPVKTDTVPREPGCQCQWEAGDSPCPVHGDDDK